MEYSICTSATIRFSVLRLLGLKKALTFYIFKKLKTKILIFAKKIKNSFRNEKFLERNKLIRVGKSMGCLKVFFSKGQKTTGWGVQRHTPRFLGLKTSYFSWIFLLFFRLLLYYYSTT